MKKQKISLFFTISDGKEIFEEKKFRAQICLVLNPAFKNKKKNAVILTIEGTFNDVPEVFDDMKNMTDNVNLSSNKVSLEYLSKKEVARIEEECSEFISMEFCAKDEESFIFDYILSQINTLADRQVRKGLLSSFNRKEFLIDGMMMAESLYKKEEEAV